VRRRVIVPRRIFSIPTALVLLLAAGAAGIAPAEDWPRWRGVRGDGSWPGPALAERWPKHGLKQVWRKPVGGGYAGVSVAAGQVMTLDRQQKPAEVERVLCFDASTGAPRWTHEYAVQYGDMAYGNGPRAAPTIDGDLVFTLGALGMVCCLQADSGKPLWSVDTREKYGARVPTWGLAASPLVWRELVIVHVGAEPGGCYLALDRRSGALKWRAHDDPAGYATPIIIEHPSGGEQFVGWTPEHIIGLDPATGRVEWEVAYSITYGVSIATPIYRQGLVLVAGYWNGSRAIRLGPARTDAKLAWEEDKFLRGLMSQPLYRAGHAYLLEKRFGVTCFELASGKKIWDDGNRLTPRGRNPQASFVWLGESDRVLALNSEGELIQARFTPQGYEELARTKIIGFTWAHPGFAGNRVFARSDEELVCVELPLIEVAR
jgi:outer membrane protein assembly factor BamB